LTSIRFDIKGIYNKNYPVVAFKIVKKRSLTCQEKPFMLCLADFRVWIEVREIIKWALVVVLFLAGQVHGSLTSASAVPVTTPPAYHITYQPTSTSIYSNMGMQNLSYIEGSDFTEILSSDDYDSILPPGFSDLTGLRFVGGVQNANEVLMFEFYDTNEELVNNFSVTFPQGGDFVWNISLSPAVSIPNDGILAIRPGDGSTGRWYLGPEAPTVGSTGDALPGLTDAGGHYLNHKFELIAVPEPASLLMLSGLLALLIRR
jgi:hypothetical protein